MGERGVGVFFCEISYAFSMVTFFSLHRVTFGDR